MTQSLNRLYPTLQALLPPSAVKEGQAKYVVAFSGGLDSSVLLHALAMQRTSSAENANHRLRAVYVHHGLQPDADAWEAHCANFCAQLNIEFKALYIKVIGIAEKGMEAAARDARYAALSSELRIGEVLLTAQHQQDQAETMLLQLLRGGSVAGLAAMPSQARFGDGWHLRPLLGVPRTELESYAKIHDLRWIEDPSNQDKSIDRNFLRHEVVPQLNTRWPQMGKVLARSAGHFAEACALLDDLAALDLSACAAGDEALSITGIQTLSAPRRHNLLRYWLRTHGQQAPSTVQLMQIERDMLAERLDAEPLFNLSNRQLRRYRDRLYCLPVLPPAPEHESLDWDVGQTGVAELILPAGCGRLRAEAQATPLTGLVAGRYRVSFAQGGERIRPAGSTHHRRLKQLFQEGSVPPWVRRRMPLIYHGQQLVAIADRWMSADCQIASSSNGFGLRWLDAPPGWNP